MALDEHQLPPLLAAVVSLQGPLDNENGDHDLDGDGGQVIKELEAGQFFDGDEDYRRAYEPGAQPEVFGSLMTRSS